MKLSYFVSLSLWRKSSNWATVPSFRTFLYHTHNGTPQSVRFLYTRDRPVEETSTTQHSQDTDINAPLGISCFLFCHPSLFLSLRGPFLLTALALFLDVLYSTLNTSIHALSGIRTRNPSNRAVADPRLRPLGRYF
jgi:hypothetical protein